MAGLGGRSPGFQFPWRSKEVPVLNSYLVLCLVCESLKIFCVLMTFDEMLGTLEVAEKIHGKGCLWPNFC